MYVVLVPLSVHYCHLLPQLTTIEQARDYLTVLESVRSSILDLVDLLRYTRKNHFIAPEYHKALLRNVFEIDAFIVEVRDEIRRLSAP